jgi:hypothetical protein
MNSNKREKGYQYAQIHQAVLVAIPFSFHFSAEWLKCFLELHRFLFCVYVPEIVSEKSAASCFKASLVFPVEQDMEASDNS